MRRAKMSNFKKASSMRGHHFTHCRYCNREYVCGDCITDNCEMGHNKRACEHYQGHMKQLAAQAQTFEQTALRINKGQSHAGAVLLAQHLYSEIAHEMTDTELAESMKELVWAHQKLGSKAEAVVRESIERLTADRVRSAGVRR